MTSLAIRRAALIAVALAALGAAATPAAASRTTSAVVGASAVTTSTTRADADADAYATRFAAAVHTCEQDPRVPLRQLQSCVHDLAAPDLDNAQIFDLWRLFTSCLSIMLDSGPDAMYPRDHYEDQVNDCLGL
jgi:hypothetical protein